MDIRLNSCGKSPCRHLDEVIAELAARQNGVVARRQLIAAGFTKRVVDYQLEKKRLHAVFTGVFSVHPKPSRQARWMAATLAAGPGAVLSHRAAAALHGIRPYDGPPEVITPS